MQPELVRAWVEQSCAAQGVPVKVTDPMVIRQVVVLLGNAKSPGPHKEDRGSA